MQIVNELVKKICKKCKKTLCNCLSDFKVRYNNSNKFSLENNKKCNKHNNVAIKTCAHKDKGYAHKKSKKVTFKADMNINEYSHSFPAVTHENMDTTVE